MTLPGAALVALMLAVLAVLAGCAAPPPVLQPEAASGFTSKPGWAHQRFAVAAAHPLAAEAGVQILRAGGSAVDAAITVQMVLTLVEPQSSGIGGGAFLLHWDGRSVTAWDGRETAPAAADERLFLLPDGKPMPFDSSPRAAWKICLQRSCTQLFKGYLWKCPALAYFATMERKLRLEAIPAWQVFRDYKACPPGATDDEVREFFAAREIPQCGLCPARKIPFHHHDPTNKEQ